MKFKFKNTTSAYWYSYSEHQIGYVGVGDVGSVVGGGVAGSVVGGGVVVGVYVGGGVGE